MNAMVTVEQVLAWAAQGAPETYRDQRASVDHVIDLAKSHQVTVVALCGTIYDRQITPNLRCIGTTRAALSRDRIATLLAELAPDRVIARTPLVPLLQELAKAQMPTLPCLADLFTRGGLKQRLLHLRMRWLLTRPHIPCVANHSLNASRSLVEGVGLPKEFVVPWDWSRLIPSETVKTGSNTPIRVFYAGAF